MRNPAAKHAACCMPGFEYHLNHAVVLLKRDLICDEAAVELLRCEKQTLRRNSQAKASSCHAAAKRQKHCRRRRKHRNSTLSDSRPHDEPIETNAARQQKHRRKQSRCRRISQFDVRTCEPTEQPLNPGLEHSWALRSASGCLHHDVLAFIFSWPKTSEASFAL